MASNHTWKFFRAGGFDQVRLDTGADLMALDELDQKLWVALACPTTGVEFDTKTLALIDTDKDGRIRAPELIAAVKWAGTCLKNPDDLLKSASELPLSAINDAIPEGRQLLASARQILANLGQERRHGHHPGGHDRHGEDFCPDPVQRRRHHSRRFGRRRRHQSGHQRYHRMPRLGDGPQRQTGGEPGESRSVLRRSPGLLRLVEASRNRPGHPASGRFDRRCRRHFQGPQGQGG